MDTLAVLSRLLSSRITANAFTFMLARQKETLRILAKHGLSGFLKSKYLRTMTILIGQKKKKRMLWG